jgi:hypothetical protein
MTSWHRVGGPLLLSLAAVAWAADPASTLPSTESIVAHMQEARARNHAQLRPYQVVRDYQLFGKEQNSKSDVTAYIDYVPPDVQNFTIHRNHGVNMGEVIVRKILESEKEILTSQGASDVSPANYSFRLVRKDVLNHQPCYVLELRPLRKDSKLLDGLMWVDATSYMILRMEGQPARAPSWWVRNIHVALEFHAVQGMWLQTALRSTANVRLLGEHTLVSHDVEYKMGGMEAVAIPVPRP